MQTRQDLSDLYDLLKTSLDEEKMLASLGILKRMAYSEERMTKVLDIAHKANQRGLSITRQVMEYSQLGGEEEGATPIRLADLIDDIVEQVREPFQAQDVEILSALESKEIFVEGRESHFRSVFENLIFNARDALLEVEDESDREIHVSLALENQSVVAEVRDNGPGIRPENLERLFEAFFTTKPKTGTGLGLGVVKKITEMYAGEIDISSELGEGATVTIRWPISIGKKSESEESS